MYFRGVSRYIRALTIAYLPRLEGTLVSGARAAVLFCKQQVVSSSLSTGSKVFPTQTRYLGRGIAFSFCPGLLSGLLSWYFYTQRSNHANTRRTA